MITLESLQVFPIKDGASGLVLATWIERSGIEGVPLRPHSILISSEEAQLLAQELNGVTEQVEGMDGVHYRFTKDDEETKPEEIPAWECCGYTLVGSRMRCLICGKTREQASDKEMAGVKSSANVADLHMHGLTYYRGAHCSGHQSQHQQVALTDV